MVPFISRAGKYGSLSELSALPLFSVVPPDSFTPPALPDISPDSFFPLPGFCPLLVSSSVSPSALPFPESPDTPDEYSLSMPPEILPFPSDVLFSPFPTPEFPPFLSSALFSPILSFMVLFSPELSPCAYRVLFSVSV